jgi:hypothetical protein
VAATSPLEARRVTRVPLTTATEAFAPMEGCDGSDSTSTVTPSLRPLTLVMIPVMSAARSAALPPQAEATTSPSANNRRTLPGRAGWPPGSMACHATGVLIREHPATELTVATRILARADALAPEGRITLRLHDVLYIAGRGVSNRTMTPYDVVSILVADGSPLLGVPPEDVDDYVAAHRAAPEAQSAGRGSDGVIFAAPTLRACTTVLLARRRGERGPDAASLERVWEELVAEARLSGALIGAFPEDATPD